MLALATGWTPDVLADLPEKFRSAAHWALFARAIVGPDGLPAQGPAPQGMNPEQRIARAKQAAAVARLKRDLFPAD